MHFDLCPALSWKKDKSRRPWSSNATNQVGVEISLGTCVKTPSLCCPALAGPRSRVHCLPYAAHRLGLRVPLCRVGCRGRSAGVSQRWESKAGTWCLRAGKAGHVARCARVKRTAVCPCGCWGLLVCPECTLYLHNREHVYRPSW